MTKALTIKQPWVHFIFNDSKDIENRSWAINEKYLNKWIAIHSGKSIDSMVDTNSSAVKDLILGSVVGLVKFSECNRKSTSKWAITGQYHWHISEKLLLPNPIKCKGALKFWNLPDLVQTEIDSFLGDRHD